MENALIRVAVAQLDYHPALFAEHRSPLEDPGGMTPLLPPQADIPAELRRRFEKLRGRVREAYCQQMVARLRAIVATCRRWEVKVLVLPEYSVPWELLVPLAHECGPMVLVAGTHRVEYESLERGVYAELGCAKSDLPEAGQAVCPVLHDRKLLGLVPKFHAAAAVSEEIEPGKIWRPIPMPEGIPGPMGVLICLDFLNRESPLYQQHVAEGLRECRFLAVPSWTASHTIGEFQAKAWEEARRYGRPVLYADHASGGGTALFVDEEKHSDLLPYPKRPGCLRPKEEGVLIADVDLGFVRPGGSRRYSDVRSVAPQAAASLVYTARPQEKEYAEWIRGLWGAADQHVSGRLGAALAYLQQHIRVLETARDQAGPTRRERLDRLLEDRGRYITNEDKLAELVTELRLHASILPFDVYRAVVLKACSEAVLRWLVKNPELSPAVSSLLVEAKKARIPPLTEEGSEAVEQVKHLVRGTTEGPVQPSSYFGASRATHYGVMLAFRARAHDFDINLTDAAAGRILGGLGFSEQLEERSLPRSANVRQDQIDRISVQLAQPYTQFNTTCWEMLCAEGHEPVASIAIQPVYFVPEWPLLARAGQGLPRWRGIKLFTLCRRGSSFVLLTFEPEFTLRFDEQEKHQPLVIPFHRAHREPILDAFEELGIDVTDIEVVDDKAISKRIDAVLTRFGGARDTVERFRRGRLAAVEGHFVEPSLSHTKSKFVDDERRSDELVRPAVEMLSEWLNGKPHEERTPRAALVLGEYGSGKSTLLAEWAWRLWNDDTKIRPILVDLARSSSRSPETLLLDSADLADTPANHAALHVGIRTGRLLPIFDGFDEMATRVTLDELPQRLTDLLDAAQIVGRIVLSSRDHYFPTEGHLNSAFEFALRASLHGPRDSERLTLCLFSPEQIQALVRRVSADEEEAAILWKRIRETYDLEELCARPLLLSMVIVSRHDLLAKKDFRRRDLYEACLRRWLSQAGGLQGEIFSHEQKRSLAETIAVETWRSGDAGTSLSDLRRILHQSFPSSFFDDVPRTAEVLETTGGMFLVREPTTFGDRFRFAHKSFLEYFLACAVVRAVVSSAENVPEALSMRPLTDEITDFLDEIIAEDGSVHQHPFVTHLRRWLLSRGNDPRQLPSSTGAAAANAVLLLVRLARKHGDASGWIPERADLREAPLVSADLSGVDLRGADLRGANLSRADLRGTRLSEADLRDAVLQSAMLDRAALDGIVASGADFRMVEAEGADLTGADLRGALLLQSGWRSCVWRRVRLEGADLFAWFADGTEESDGAASLAPFRLDDPRVELVVDPDCHEQRIDSIGGAWLSGGRLLGALTKDGRWVVWDIASATRLVETVDSRFQSLTFTTSGDVVALVDEERHLHLWRAARSWEISRISASARHVCLSSDGAKLALGDSEGNVWITDTETGEALAPARRWGDEIEQIAFSSNGLRLAVLYRTGPLIAWDADDGFRVLAAELQEKATFAWSPSDGDEIVLSFGDFMLRSVDARTGTEKTSMLLPQSGFLQTSISPAGRYLAGLDNGGIIHVWDLERRKEVAAVEQYPRPMMSPPDPERFAWSPDGTRLATFGSRVRLWDWRSGRVLSKLPRVVEKKGFWGSGGLGHLKWSPDSRRLLWRAPMFEGALQVDVEEHRIRLLPLAELPDVDAADGPNARTDDEEIWFEPIRAKVVSVHHNPFFTASPSPDRAWAATQDPGGRMALWRLPSGEHCFSLTGCAHTGLLQPPAGERRFVGRHRDERRIAVTAGTDVKVRTYVPAGTLLRSTSSAEAGDGAPAEDSVSFSVTQIGTDRALR